MVLVLNKIDLVPATLAAAWKNYFQTKFPRYGTGYRYISHDDVSGAEPIAKFGHTLAQTMNFIQKYFDYRYIFLI